MFITRIYDSNKKKVKFYDLQKKKYTQLPHLSKIYVPPAYTDVRMSCNPESKVLAYGFDSKGRKQYVYNKQFIEEQNELKFSDLRNFGKKIKRIRADCNRCITDYIKSGNSLDKLMSRDLQTAVIIHLIDKCNFRIGNEKYKDLYNSYGVTTLNSVHISETPNNVKICFIGKKGVENSAVVSNRFISQILRHLKRVNENREYLFCYTDSNNLVCRITERQINRYLKKYDPSITVKMFRTWAANNMLLRELLKMEMPNTQRQTRKNIQNAIKKSARLMHHTSGVSKKSYMNNEILSMYENSPQEFVEGLKRYKNSNGRLPDTDTLFSRLLNDLN